MWWMPGLFAILIPLPTHGLDEQGLNQKIVQFCEQHRGKQVGDGDCFDLAFHARKESGAARRPPDSPSKGDYVWGRLIVALEATPTGLKIAGKLKDIKPGDILQFRDTTFKGAKYRRSYRHHTAVAWRVLDNGRDVVVLHQNDGGRKFVTERNLQLDDLKEGWVRVYRSEPKP
jgi:hypothetical protein